MARASRHVPLRGSECAPLREARAAGRVLPDESVELTLCLRSRASAQQRRGHLKAALAGRQHVTHEEFEAQHSAHPADVERIERFAREYGLTVVQADAGRRTIVLAGASADCCAAFRVTHRRYASPAGPYRAHSGPVHIPRALAGIVEGVLGLDDRPVARRRSLRAQTRTLAPIRREQIRYTPLQIAELYAFPGRSEGRGQCIALIELGGGYRKQDLNAFAKRLSLPAPAVTAVSVAGAHNAPRGKTASYDGEVEGDIEVVAGFVPRARLVVYFAPNTERGLFEAVSRVVHDRRHNPSVISISWGESESLWTPRTMRLLDKIFQEAAALGITVCCASGDDGAWAGGTKRWPEVCFPASSPHVLACGGTRLVARRGRISSETVWNDDRGSSGGGVSRFFPRPDWQASAGVPVLPGRAHRKGRGVPDVAANADPATGYSVLVNGRWIVGGGTSAATPVWAALVALINEQLGRCVGFLNPFLYLRYLELLRCGAFREITEGTNGAFAARKGWNACTGLGTPDGARLARALLSQAGEE